MDVWLLFFFFFPVPDLKYLTGTPDTPLVSPIPTPLQAHTYLSPRVESGTGCKAGKKGDSHTPGNRNHVFLPDSSVLGLSVQPALHSTYSAFQALGPGGDGISTHECWAPSPVYSVPNRNFMFPHLPHFTFPILNDSFTCPCHFISALPRRSRKLMYRMAWSAVGLERGGRLTWSCPWGSSMGSQFPLSFRSYGSALLSASPHGSHLVYSHLAISALT